MTRARGRAGGGPRGRGGRCAPPGTRAAGTSRPGPKRGAGKGLHAPGPGAALGARVARYFFFRSFADALGLITMRASLVTITISSPLSSTSTFWNPRTSTSEPPIEPA